MAAKKITKILTFFFDLPSRIINYYTGSLNRNSIEYWQQFIFYVITFTGVISLTISSIPSLIIIYSRGFIISGSVFILLYLINVFTVFIKLFSYKIKTLIIGFNFYLIGVISLIIAGPVGESGIWFSAGVLFYSLFIGLRVSILTFMRQPYNRYYFWNFV